MDFISGRFFFLVPQVASFWRRKTSSAPTSGWVNSGDWNHLGDRTEDVDLEDYSKKGVSSSSSSS